MDTSALLVSFVYGKADPGLGFRAVGAGSLALRRKDISYRLPALGKKFFRPFLLKGGLFGWQCLRSSLSASASAK